jgi:hypothetical protein
LISDNKIDVLTGVKSPDDPKLAIRPSSRKNKDESDVSSNPNQLLFDREYKPNEISETRPTKFNSTSIINETTHVNTDPFESTKHTNQSLKKNIISNIDSSKMSPSDVHAALPTSESLDVSPKINSKLLKSESDSDQQKKVS